MRSQAPSPAEERQVRGEIVRGVITWEGRTNMFLKQALGDNGARLCALTASLSDSFVYLIRRWAPRRGWAVRLLVQATCSIALLALSQGASAAEQSYTCEVLRVYDLADDASLEVSGFQKTMKGGTFSVSRVTGEIIGQVVPTLMAASTRVVDRGSAENSFKAVADFEGQVQVLEVQEFKQGNTKPFIALSMGGAGVVTGTCK
jgi:hypothetical protein